MRAARLPSRAIGPRATDIAYRSCLRFGREMRSGNSERGSKL
jgi:hypothetical protein